MMASASHIAEQQRRFRLQKAWSDLTSTPAGRFSMGVSPTEARTFHFILAKLKKGRSAAQFQIHDLSRARNMSDATIRRHLALLESAGLISFTSPGKGRPSAGAGSPLWDVWVNTSWKRKVRDHG